MIHNLVMWIQYHNMIAHTFLHDKYKHLRIHKNVHDQQFLNRRTLRDVMFTKSAAICVGIL